MTQAERKKRAEEKIFEKLMDPTLLSSQKGRIVATLADWASTELGIVKDVAASTFSNATMETQTDRAHNMFRIRIRL
jgi:hypothetical protein